MEHHGPTSWLLQLPFLPHDPNLIHVNAAVVVFLLILVGSIIANRMIANEIEAHVVPSDRFTIVNVVDVVMEGLYGMVTGTLGPSGDKHFAFIASLFIFILTCNLFGLLPFSSAPTASTNTTFALGAATFFYYHAYGIKEQGLKSYAEHFLMGLGWFGILIAMLELISHAIRPLSLGIRLFLNMFVDHTLSASFASIFAWLLPVPLLLFGVLISTIQAFVFSLLSCVYVQMATEHEEHH